MLPSEVKAKIGNPKAVEGGFPNSRNLIILDLPQMAGQMINSTWFYASDPVSVAMPNYSYFVNGQMVDEQIFLNYRGATEVYFYEDKLISQGMGDSYKRTRSQKLKIVPLDRKQLIQKTLEQMQ